MTKFKTLKAAQNQVKKTKDEQIDVSTNYGSDAMLEMNIAPFETEINYFLNTSKGRKEITSQRAFKLIEGND